MSVCRTACTCRQPDDIVRHRFTGLPQYLVGEFFPDSIEAIIAEFIVRAPRLPSYDEHKRTFGFKTEGAARFFARSVHDVRALRTGFRS